MVHRSIVPGEHRGLGDGNLSASPLFVDKSRDFRLQPESRAIGRGPNGLDMGARVPGWASVAGRPPKLTSLTAATFTVGGPGITHYKLCLNDGPYGAETPRDTLTHLAGLSPGRYKVSVLGKNSAGVWQDPTRPTVSSDPNDGC